MQEYWADVVDFPGYIVSSFGRVANRNTERVLKPGDNGSGSLIVNLRVGRQTIVKQLRWIVAEVFLEPPPLTMDFIPQHIDRDYRNCRADNLEWMASSDVRWRLYHERHGYFPYKHPVKITDTGEVFENIFECAKAVDGLAKEIHRCTMNSEFQYKGYHFEYPSNPQA